MNDNSGNRHINELDNIDDGIEELFYEMPAREIVETMRADGESVEEIVARVRRIFARAYEDHTKTVDREDMELLCTGGLMPKLQQDNLGGSTAELTRTAFIRLLELTRLERGLTHEQFASKANVDVAELVSLETKPDYMPTPRTIFKLAGFLNVPTKRLMALAGLVQLKDAEFDDAAVRFAANSGPVEKLSSEEHKALREYVKFLCER
jgi:transcriptional regulator with XRE-family HTH domain